MRTINKIFLSLLLAMACSNAFAEKAFKGGVQLGGKVAKLDFLIARKGEPFAGKPVTVLVFSERDASGDKHPIEAAGLFGHFGDALVIQLSQSDSNWDVIGTNLVIGEPKGSSTGLIDAKDVKVAGGEISGHLTTRPGAKLFDEPLDVNLDFHVKQP